MPLHDTLNPKNNTTNICGKFRRNWFYQYHETKVVVYICKSRNQSKCLPNQLFSRQIKKPKKVVNTLWTKLLLGVSQICHFCNILKTFEEFWSHQSKIYHKPFLLPSLIFLDKILLKSRLNWDKIRKKLKNGPNLINISYFFHKYWIKETIFITPEFFLNTITQSTLIMYILNQKLYNLIVINVCWTLSYPKGPKTMKEDSMYFPFKIRISGWLSKLI